MQQIIDKYCTFFTFLHLFLCVCVCLHTNEAKMLSIYLKIRRIVLYCKQVRDGLEDACGLMFLCHHNHQYFWFWILQVDSILYQEHCSNPFGFLYLLSIFHLLLLNFSNVSVLMNCMNRNCPSDSDCRGTCFSIPSAMMIFIAFFQRINQKEVQKDCG